MKCYHSAQNGPRDFGAGEWTRTIDLLITNQLLYQLSYTGLGRNPNRSIGLLTGRQLPDTSPFRLLPISGERNGGAATPKRRAAQIITL